MAKKVEDKQPGKQSSSQKIAGTFAPINSTDRPVTKRDFAAKSLKLRRRFGAKKIGLSVGFIILVTIVGTLVFSIINDKAENSTSNQVKSVLSNDEMKEYTSAEYKFSIKMPGFPSIRKNSIKDGDKQIPQTIYERRLEGNSKIYELVVNDYSGVSLNEKQAIEVKLNERIRNVPDAKLISSKPGFYNKLNALEANYSFREKDKDYEARVRFLVKDSKIYAVTLTGYDQAKFEEFANSLRLD